MDLMLQFENSISASEAVGLSMLLKWGMEGQAPLLNQIERGIGNIYSSYEVLSDLEG